MGDVAAPSLEHFREIPDCSLVRSADGDLAVCYVGRRMMPETVQGRLSPSGLEIWHHESEPGIRLVGLEEEVREWLLSAPVVYLGRVFDDAVHWSRVEMGQPS